MANKNEMRKVVKGDLFIQDNQQRKFGSDPQYVVLWAVEPYGRNGETPIPLMFTQEEIERAIIRAVGNEEDIPALGSEAPVATFDEE